MSYSQWYPLNLNLINNVEDIFFLAKKCLFLKIVLIPQVISKETTLENIKFQSYKHGFLSHSWSCKAFKGTVVNRT